MRRPGRTSTNRRFATPPIKDGPLEGLANGAPENLSIFGVSRPRVATGLWRSYPVYAALILLLVTGCREPMSVERFVKGEGPYTFFVDLSDSTATYDFDFYTRVDAPLDSLRRMQALPLTVTWTSPSFRVFREEVYLPLEGQTTFFSRQVRAPYRAGVRPSVWGQWTLAVRVTDAPEGLRGMGLIVRRNKEEQGWDTEN